MSRTAELLRTPLADWHEAHGAKLVDFAGWAMPIQYGSIVEEHHATRRGVGLFDVSHMGRVSVSGSDAAGWIDALTTRRVAGMEPGQVRYSLVCNDRGGALDDILVGRSADQDDWYDLVVNASNRVKLLAWFEEHMVDGDVSLVDRTEATAMIAVQGPDALAALAKLGPDLADLRYYRSREADVAGARCGVSRTGYTGEDGFEIVCYADAAAGIWQALIDSGAAPCGLAARDTLRLEAGMPLYGHELGEDITPVQAGLGFAVSLKATDGSPRDFVGREAIVSAKANDSLPRRVGLFVEGKRAPREGYKVLAGGQPCGVVTSGTHSPTLDRPIAMAYVDPVSVAEGGQLAADVRGTAVPATLTDLPFYKRAN